MPALLTPAGHLVTPMGRSPAAGRAMSESPKAGPTILEAPAKMHLQKRTPLSPLKVNGQSKSFVNTAIGGKAGFLTKTENGSWQKLDFAPAKGDESKQKLEIAAPSGVVKRALNHKPAVQEEVNCALAEINHSIGELAFLLESEKLRKSSRLSGSAMKANAGSDPPAVVEASVGFLRVKEVHNSFSDIVKHARRSFSGFDSVAEVDVSVHKARDEGPKKWDTVEIPVDVATLNPAPASADDAHLQSTYRSHWTKPAVKTPTKDKDRDGSRLTERSEETSFARAQSASRSQEELSLLSARDKELSVDASFAAKNTSSPLHEASSSTSHPPSAPDVSPASPPRAAARSPPAAAPEEHPQGSRNDRDSPPVVAPLPSSEDCEQPGPHELTIQALLDAGVGGTPPVEDAGWSGALAPEAAVGGHREAARERHEAAAAEGGGREGAGARGGEVAGVGNLSCDLSNTCSLTDRSLNISAAVGTLREVGAGQRGDGAAFAQEVTLNSTANSTAFFRDEGASQLSATPPHRRAPRPNHSDLTPPFPRHTPPRPRGSRRSPSHLRRGGSRVVMSDLSPRAGAALAESSQIEVSVSEASESSTHFDSTCELSVNSPLPTLPHQPRVDRAAAPAPLSASKAALGRAGVGIKFKEASDGSGFPVAAVVPGGPADLAGVMAGDVLMFVATNTTSPDTTTKTVARSIAEAGRNFHIVVRRDNEVLAALIKRPLGGSAQVGAAISKQPGLTPRVESVVPGSPACLAGLKAGDVIVAVGSVCVSSLAREQLLPLLTGEAGSLVLLGLLRRASAHVGTVWHLLRRRGGVPLSIHEPQAIEPKPCPSPSILRHHRSPAPGVPPLRLPSNAVAGAPPPPDMGLRQSAPAPDSAPARPSPRLDASSAARRESPRAEPRVSAQVGQLHVRPGAVGTAGNSTAAVGTATGSVATGLVRSGIGAASSVELRGPAMPVPEAPSHVTYHVSSGAQTARERQGRGAGFVGASVLGNGGAATARGASETRGAAARGARGRERKGSLQTITEDGGGRDASAGRWVRGTGHRSGEGHLDPMLLADIPRPTQPRGVEHLAKKELEAAALRYLEQLDAYKAVRSERARKFEQDVRSVMLQTGCTRQHSVIALDGSGNDVVEAILAVLGARA